GGMHITADRLLVEVIDDQGRSLGPGLSGEIVVTNFDTPEMPFIRYRTGDVGILSGQECSCGRTLPLLERVDGRRTDFIQTPDGRQMHGLSLIYVLREVAGVDAFRITQRTLSSFVVEIVRNPHFECESEQFILQAFAQRLRSAVTLNFQYPDAISPLASGK